MYLLPDKIIEKLRVPANKKIRLQDFQTDISESDEIRRLGKDAAKQQAEEILQKSKERLAESQELLYADDRHSVLAVFQAMDAAGKDGTIKHVMSGINPQGCQVTSFKQPSQEELDHDFLWRCAKALPERGRIGIFNRSYYEEALVVKVHPEYLENQRLPPGKRGKEFWQERYDDINAFERHLSRNGTVILKFFLYISKAEQKKRFLKRLDEPEKNWKFSAADVAERKFWDDYMAAYEAAISATSTDWAPWYVIPADEKWVTRTIVADILATTIHNLDLQYPKVDPAQLAKFAACRKQLLEEAE